LHGGKNWFRVKSYVKGRTDVQCRERWMNVLNPALNTGPWAAEEDLKLKGLVAKHGTSKWASVSAEMGSRTDNQCWRRWKSLNVDQYLTNARSSKRKLSLSCSVLPTDKISSDTYVLENIKFNDLLPASDQSKLEAKKCRFPAAKFSRILEQFQVRRSLQEACPVSIKPKNIPAFPAEVCTAEALQSVMNVAGNSPDCCQAEPSHLHFQMLKKRFRALFFWPMLISKCDLTDKSKEELEVMKEEKKDGIN
jgi:hypothetical protein